MLWNFTCLAFIVYTYFQFKILSFGAGWPKLPVFRNDNDVHILHCGHYDVGWCDIPNSRLGNNGNGNVHSVFTVLWIYIGVARITSMASGQRTTRGGAKSA